MSQVWKQVEPNSGCGNTHHAHFRVYGGAAIDEYAEDESSHNLTSMWKPEEEKKSTFMARQVEFP